MLLGVSLLGVYNPNIMAKTAILKLYTKKISHKRLVILQWLLLTISRKSHVVDFVDFFSKDFHTIHCCCAFTLESGRLCT